MHLAKGLLVGDTVNEIENKLLKILLVGGWPFGYLHNAVEELNNPESGREKDLTRDLKILNPAP